MCSNSLSSSPKTECRWCALVPTRHCWGRESSNSQCGGKHSTPPARHFWVLPQCLYFLFRTNKESFLNCIGLTCLTPVISAANSPPSKPGLAIFEDPLRPSGSLPSCKPLLSGPLWGCNVSLASFYPDFPEETWAFHPQIVFHTF